MKQLIEDIAKALVDIPEEVNVNVIEGDGYPPWTYTIGLYDTWSHPELILIGRSRATAHHILDCIATCLDTTSAST